MLTLTLPRKTPLHSIPAGSKLLFLAVFSVLLFWCQSIIILMGLLCMLSIVHLCLGLDVLRYAGRMMRPIILFTAIIIIYHAVIDDLIAGMIIVLRMVILVAVANLVTMTTKLTDMISVVEKILTPLRRLGVNTHAFGVATAMVIRFIPILINKAAALRESWQARSSKRAGWHIIMPLFLTAIDDADHVAEALKARGGVTKE